MALTSITKDFIVKSGLIVQGTTAPVTTATGNLGTLQVNGGGAFAKDIMVASTATVYGATNLNNILNVSGNTTVGANKFTIDSSTGNTYADGNVGILGTLNSTGTFSVNTDKFTVDGSTGNMYANGNAGVLGTFNSTGTLSVNVDKFTVDGATGNTYADGNVGVLGTFNSTGTLSVNVDKFTVDGATGNTYVAGNAGVLGTFNSTGTLTVNTDKFTVDGASGNTHVEGTFNVTGTSYLHSTLDVLGVTTLLDATAGGVGVGALVVANGGASIKGDLYADSTSTAVDTGSGGGAVRVAGGVWIGDNLIVKSTANDTGTNTANALYVAGGAWIDKTLIVDGNVTINQNLTVNGTATYVYSTVTMFTDNILALHTNPTGAWGVDDGKDIGTIFNYYKGAAKTGFLGFDNASTHLEWWKHGSEDATGNFIGTDWGTFKTGGIKLVDTTASSSTSTGALTVEGGVGIAGDMYVGGTIHANEIIGFGTVTANVTTATNLQGGAIGQIPIQNGSGSTAFIAAGTANAQVLTWSGTTATWASASGTSVGNSTTATNLADGTAGQVPYQSAPGTTSFYGPGTAGQLLMSNSTDAPAYQSTLTVTGGTVNVTSITASTTTATGALVVGGGLGVGGNLNVGGTVNVASVTASTTTATGALVVGGGLGVGGNLNVGGTVTVGLGSAVVSSSNGDLTLVATGGNVTTTNVVIISNTTGVTSAATGALQVAGGVGVGGGLFVGGVLTATSNVYITDSDASSTTTAAAGALQVTGGVGIAGGLYVDQDAYVNANLYVQGTLFVQGNSLDGVDTITGSTGTFIDLVSTGTIFANDLKAGTFEVNTFTALSVVSLTVVSTATLDANLNTYGYDINQVDAGIKTAGGIKALGNVSVGKVLYAGMNDAGDVGGESPEGKTIDGVFITNSMQAGGTYNSISSTSTQTLDSWDKTVYTSAKYMVQVMDSGNIHTQELMVIHDGTDVYISEYGIITNNGELGIFDGVISGANVLITFSPTSATNMTIQVVRQSILTGIENYC